MKETENGTLKYKFIEKDKLFRIGIKLNNDMVKLLSDRIKDAEKTGRGINILIGGDLMRGIAEIESKQGKEYSHTLFDIGEIQIFNWDCDKAYNGKHKFWFEGFMPRK